MEESELTPRPPAGGNNPQKVLVIGGSAGALSMVMNIVPLLKADMSVAVLIVLHRKATEDNVLMEVLTSKTDFEVKEAEDKDELVPGVIYLAPADYHVLVERDGGLTLDDSEKVNFSRPSIDVSFESAVEIYGSSLTCVLLSGANADGAVGLAKARAKGAKVVIQDPKSAEFNYMPNQALAIVKPDLVLNADNMERLIELLLP